MNGLKISRAPNYDELPLVVFNAVNHQIVLPLPEHAGSVPVEIAQTDIDVDNYQWIDPENPSREGCLSLVRNLGWDIFIGDSNSYMGIIFLDVNIMENRSNKFDFLDEESFKSWMLKRNSELYGVWNEEIRKEREINGLECLPIHLFSYAKSSEDIFTVVANQRKWFAEKSGCIQGGSEISMRFRTPINSKYSLSLQFDWGATRETRDAFKAEIDDLQLEYLQKVRLIPNT